MPRLIPLVEGDGDLRAVPILVQRLLLERGHDGWFVDGKRAKPVRSLPNLRNRLPNFLEYLRIEEPDAALILLDLDDGCPCETAIALASDVAEVGLPFPTAVVFAHREFEAWFLASLPSIAASTPLLADGLDYEAEPERRRGCKEWLNKQMPRGRRYEETLHQAAFCRHLDVERAASRSRSFRRLRDALDGLVQTAGRRGVATPAGPREGGANPQQRRGQSGAGRPRRG